MDEMITIKVDVEDSNWLEGLDILDLFPEHYSPSLVESDEGEIIDISFPGGKSRFIFNEYEVECHFDYYDEDEDYDNEWEEFGNYSDDVGVSLVAYVADQITTVTGLSTNYA